MGVNDKMRSWLRDLRLSKRLTQEDVASMLGISQTMYSKIETGERQEKMDLELASKLANIFKISLKKINELEEPLRQKRKES